MTVYLIVLGTSEIPLCLTYRSLTEIPIGRLISEGKSKIDFLANSTFIIAELPFSNYVRYLS